MIDYVRTGRLQVAKVLADFIDHDVLPGTDVERAAFWSGLEQAIETLVPRNRALLAKRDVAAGGYRCLAQSATRGAS